MSQATWAFENEPCMLSVEGRSFEVLSLDGIDAVSELFCYQATCRSGEAPPALEELIAARVELRLQDGFGAMRPVKGIIAEAWITTTDEPHASLHLVIRPEAYRLTLGRDSRVFQDASVVDIVADVLRRGGVDARWELSGTYRERVYTAQYRESDWQFASRLLEEEGIHYWFDHDEGGSILVFADRSMDAPELHGGAGIEFVDDAGAGQAGREQVVRFGDAIRVVPSKFTVRSFDPERPKLQVEGSAGDGLREWYDAPGAGPGDPEIAQRRAQLRAEGAAASSDRRTGMAISVRIVPGRLLQLGGHPLARLDGRFFLTRSHLQIRQRRTGETFEVERPLECSFECTPAALPFRPPEDTPPPKQAGLQTARVVGPPGEEVYPDATARVRIQQRWDRQGQWDDQAGRFCRVVQRGTADSMLLPRMGWNVLTLSEEGSVDLPIVVARIFDGEHPPRYSLPDHKTRVTFCTATVPGDGSFNELYLEDTAGAQQMFMNASNDMDVVIQDAKTETVHRNVTRSVGANATTDVGDNTAQNVVGNQETTVAANDSLDIGKAFMTLIGGDELLTIGGLRKLWVGLTESTHVINVRQLMVGGALIDISLGDISLTSPVTNVLVGGAMVKSAVQELNETVGGMASVQTIGGAKFELAAQSRTIKVTGAYTETVGGAMTAKTPCYLDRSDTSLAYTVAGSVESSAPDIVVEGKTSITIKSGGSSILIRPSEVVITTSAFDQSGGSLKATAGGQVKVN